MSEFIRPKGFGNGHRDDPEEQYRAGYQHGAQRVREMVEAGPLDRKALARWIETDLQTWRHDRNADPKPPNP